jgi:hypothetical protein
MLGPARFTHIETCTREVCRAFKVRDEIEDCVAQLNSLDAVLAGLREELAQNTVVAPDDMASDAIVSVRLKQTKVTDYHELVACMDLKKARRLITARENSIKSVKTKIAKMKA